jgi:GNAT acetyltransferase-like protein
MPADDVLVREAGDEDAARWNEFLETAPDASPLALYEWRHVLRETYGIPTRFLIAERNGKIAGLLAAYQTAALSGERTLYSCRGGLIAADAAAARAIEQAVARELAEHQLTSALITSGWQTAPGLSDPVVRQTVHLAIGRDEDGIWRGLRDKTRNMIRRAEKEGVEVSAGNDQIEIVADQYQGNMLRLGVPIHSRRFFRSVVERLGQRSSVLIARHRGKAIASMLLHFTDKVACYPHQNADLSLRNLAPIQKLNWEAMKLCAQRGVKILDMGESRDGSPVFQSKVNFGGTPRDVFYYQVQGRAASSRRVNPVLRAASVAEGWLAAHAPLPMRRYFALRRLTHGRLV